MQKKTNLYNQLIDNEVHLGDKELTPHKSMLPYIKKSIKGQPFIDLDLTILSLKQISNLLTNFLLGIEEKKGSILFVGHPYNKVIDKIIKYAALSCGQTYFPFSLNKLNHTKLKNELKKLNPNFIIVFSIPACKTVLKQCEKLMIPSIGICNTSSNIENVTYFIPGNDDSYKAIYFYSYYIKTVIEKAINKNFNI